MKTEHNLMSRFRAIFADRRRAKYVVPVERRRRVKNVEDQLDRALEHLTQTARSKSNGEIR